ncbi:hypothetical protein AXF42_Ash002441 [Apostasia shenzhenica]|uniref:H/ACA ribonucleoprotein complex non-core subunit NAF1 n=1 Tax=Apostasia shenzhenica TaxID=1088818 RepID=A0A2I0ANJ4_9ASPA|nr:hypothetical protein AXF42_Ash002441 [Apostasia shenzhenica]
MEGIKIDGLNKSDSRQENSDDSGLAFKTNGEELKASPIEIEEPKIDESKKNGNFQEDIVDSGREFKKDVEELKASSADMEGIKINGLKNESCQEGDDEEDSDSEGSRDSSSSDDSTSSESSSSATTSSSSSEEEEFFAAKRTEKSKQLEEGEVGDSDAEAATFLSDEEEEGAKGPIVSKREIQDLRPVPKVVALLEPCHQMLPVGVISAIMSNRVVVDGSISHNPLDEGSILWVTHSRRPLGIVDEIFGPVKNPYYVIRYNSEEEVPKEVSVGVAISFVMEFASHILNNKELYRKGYDASGDNDEEVDDEVEFSDDEKEAEYKTSLRQVKRAATGNRKPMKQVVRLDKERATSKASRIQHMEIQTHASSSMTQSFLTDHAIPQPAPPTGHCGFGSQCSKSVSAAEKVLATTPTLPTFPPPMQSVNFFGNPSQPMLTQQPDTLWGRGFSPQLLNTAWQDNLPTQLQNQNILFNNFVNLIAFQQQLQQLIPYQEISMPWHIPGSLQPIGAGSSQQRMGQNDFATPFVNGLMNGPGTSDLGKDQRQSQVPPSFVPYFQFNEHPPGSTQGRRPYQRGGGQSYRRGGPQNNHR